MVMGVLPPHIRLSWTKYSNFELLPLDGNFVSKGFIIERHTLRDHLQW